LQLGRLWLRLAERRTWTPLASADALRQTLDQVGQYGHPEEALTVSVNVVAVCRP